MEAAVQAAGLRYLTATKEGRVMRRTIIMLGGIALLGSSVSGWAFHPEPTVAKKFVTALVTSHAECIPPGDTVYNNLWPACLIGTAAPTCRFGADGSGKVIAKVTLGTAHDIKLVAKLNNLTNCEGRKLQGAVKVRVTLDGCETTNAPCTLIDQELPAGECVVDQGKCSVSESINEGLLNFLPTGKRTGIQILGCRMIDVTPGDPVEEAFSCGLLVP